MTAAAYPYDAIPALGLLRDRSSEGVERPRVKSTQDEAKAAKAAQTADERALIRRCQAGDAGAFQVLVQRYQRRAYAVALGMVRNPDDAMDLTQEAFVKVHRYLDRFEGSSSFYTWLYRIVVNVCIDHLRKHKKHRAVDYDDNRVQESSGPDELLPSMLGMDPSRALKRSRIRKLVARALQDLTPNHRAVILMREVEGLSYTEMAEAMQCSKGTIMSRLFHARRNMQAALRELLGVDTDEEALALAQ